MDYCATLDFLFTQFPVFQNSGQSAYKPGLDNALALAAMMGNPHKGLRCIHIAGTNGKGSTAHTLAAILQKAGLRTALFTSPHLIDFRERIRVDGAMIPQERVVDFVERYLRLSSSLHPSFFELTTIMAFEWFKEMNVDVAVIETGLGGRLDTTNIIAPELSVITNISLDHTALLGNTPEAIAAEKAGIIKPGIPVVIGEAKGEVRNVFQTVAERQGSPAVFAEDMMLWRGLKRMPDGRWLYIDTPYGNLVGELSGECQPKNAATVLASIGELRRRGFRIPDRAIAEGFENVTATTGLMGRWMKGSDSPLTICDTGHNEGGWQYIWQQLHHHRGHKHIVLGFVSDKDVNKILYLAKAIGNSSFYFTQASVDRAMPAERVQSLAAEKKIFGCAFKSVAEAYEKALAEAGKSDLIFVGGSTFVVADFLKVISQR